MFTRPDFRYWPATAAFLIVGLLVWVALPGMVVTLDDDFWYLRSVVKTIQKGRPWPDDWLTPWAASSSLISAGLFKLTGSFTMAIHLQLAAAAGLVGTAMTLYLKRQGVSGPRSLLATALVLLCPTALFMFLMFTGVALYLACLWWCLLLADQRRWGWFLLLWAVALASRQSAVVWMALPGWHWLGFCWQNRSLIPRTREQKTLAAVLPASVLVLILIRLGMNPTEGQRLVVGGLQGALTSGRILLPLGLGAVAALAGMAVTALLRLPDAWGAVDPREKAIRLCLAAVLAGAGASAIPWFAGASLNTHDCYRDDFTRAWLPALGAALGAGLALGGTLKFRYDALLAAAGSLLLVSIYAGQFDYYFIEAFSFALVAAWPAHALAPAVPMPRPTAIWPRRAVLIGSAVLALGTAVWHARSLIRLAAQQDRAAGVIMLYENSLRSGRLAPQDVGITTFGYHGWLFQEYYAAHEGRHLPQLGGFMRYGQPWDNTAGTGILTSYPKEFRNWRGVIPTRNNTTLRDARGLAEIGSIEASFLHFYKVRYQLLRGNTAGPVVPGKLPDPAIYRRLPFPLNDEEWRHLILTSPPL